MHVDESMVLGADRAFIHRNAADQCNGSLLAAETRPHGARYDAVYAIGPDKKKGLMHAGIGMKHDGSVSNVHADGLFARQELRTRFDRFVQQQFIELLPVHQYCQTLFLLDNNGMTAVKDPRSEAFIFEKGGREREVQVGKRSAGDRPAARFLPRERAFINESGLEAC
jgi:hypothetical protein